MTGREIILRILGEKKIGQWDLARMVGAKNQSNVSETLKRDIKLRVFVKYLDAMGYRVVVEKKGVGRPSEDVMVVTAGEE